MRGILVVVALAACGPKAAPPPPRPESKFAPGEATLRVAITELPTTPGGRRQKVALIVRDASGATHPIHQMALAGSCAVRGAGTDAIDLEADARVIVAIECAADDQAAPEIRIRVTLDGDAVTVTGDDGEHRFPTPTTFSLRAE
jgi:hypothetical protein